MQQAKVTPASGKPIMPSTLAFYRGVLQILNQASLPYLVGGAYAFNHFTKINRQTEDFDLFVARADYDRISDALEAEGFRTELTYPHWLGKIHNNGDFIDLIFNSGNAIAEVDEEWFQHAVPAEIFGVQTQVCPVEETIWSKAYIMERERFDGADVAHLILTQGKGIDWPRLLRRFGQHWRLLLSHLTLFGLIYPAHRDVVPNWIMQELIDRLHTEMAEPLPEKEICGGTLLSREQYLNDINGWGYLDARVAPHGNMSEQDTEKWTAAIKEKNH